MTSSIDIVIVNWNAGAQLAECVASIPRAAAAGVEVRRTVIVDNASVDGSVEEAIRAADLPLTIIRNQHNAGFAAACNQGAQGSTADFLLFLNPDTRLLGDALAKPAAFLQRPDNRAVGIVGIQLVDAEQHVARTCARFPTPGRLFGQMLGLDRLWPTVFPTHFMVEWDHQQTRVVDQVMGAFFFIRRSVFESLGGFDERFFVYFEEVDMARRALGHGWQTVYLSEASAYHRGAGTATAETQGVRLFYRLRSRALYIRKHFPRWQSALLVLGTLVIEPVSRLLLAAVRRSPAEMKDVMRAYARLWRAAPRGFAADQP